MPAIPTSEPRSFTAGDTVQWIRSLPDYPASAGWSLKYSLQAPGKALITVTAAADGDDHAVTIDAATSADYAPGSYLWTGYVENGSVRYAIGRETITIFPSPLAALGGTHATRTLALIEAAIEGRVPNGMESTNIDGQQLDRIPLVDLLKLRDQYRREVAMERDAALGAAGIKVRRTIGIRFVKP